MTFEEWAVKTAEEYDRQARHAGLGSGRYFYWGVRAAVLVEAGDPHGATVCLELAVSGGAKGSEGKRGLRHGRAMVEGVRGMLRGLGDQNAAEWQEGADDAGAE